MATMGAVQQPPQGYGPPPAPSREGRWFLGCAGLGCLAFAGTVTLICFVAFLDHYGFVNDSILKTVRRCRTFGC